MSIKVSSGFIWLLSDLDEIHKEVMIYREELKKIFNKAYLETLCNLAISEYDTNCIEDSPLKTEAGYLNWAYNTIQELIPKYNGQHHLLCPETILYVIPRNEKLLGYLSYLHPEAEKIWFEKPFVKEWGCCTSGDKPESISDEEWQERVEDWNFWGKYKLQGFTLVCHDTEAEASLNTLEAFLKSDINFFKPYYISYEERLNQMKDVILNKHFDDNPTLSRNEKKNYNWQLDPFKLGAKLNKITKTLFTRN